MMRRLILTAELTDKDALSEIKALVADAPEGTRVLPDYRIDTSDIAADK